MNKESEVTRVRVSFTETYKYDLDIEVYPGETIEDAMHEADLLIDRDKEWIEKHRDTIRLECRYEHNTEIHS